MKKLLCALPLLAFCGCLSPVKDPPVSYWLMEYRDSSVAVKEPKYGVVRFSQVIVSQPFSGERLVVLRKDGTVAFDSHNVFAAPPPILMRNLGMVALKSSGLFSDVIGASSGASSSHSVEVFVRRLALDCRAEDSRRALAEMTVRVLDGKCIVASVEGESSVDASDGDFGVAFSKAVSAAFSSALSKLR